ncbi:MAG: exodeoxyribonuclease VII large subunit, partial [Desulfobulbaceae bacterium]
MPIPHPDEVLTVSQLTVSIKTVLEGSYRFVHIRGEISNLRIPSSGHRYFILKDSSAQIRAVLFRQQVRYLGCQLGDGQQVICHGRISVYEQRGEYQLIVDIVEHIGTGSLQIAYEELKRRLAAEGLFDAANKKPVPAFPRNIIVISSPTGAAIHDFLTVWRRRRSPATIRLLPVRVQGAGAGEEIARAIDRAGTIAATDIIVLCRGGGSIEDLWAFNEEVVARAIAGSEVPVVTGIGHEIDFTIADFCADLRAPTPTGAAEHIIPDTGLLTEKVARLEKKLAASVAQLLADEQRRLDNSNRILGRYRETLQRLALRLDLSVHRFSRACQLLLHGREQRLAELQARLSLQTPLHRLRYGSLRLEHLSALLVQQIQRILSHREARLGALAALLNSVSPLATLARGYAIVRKEARQPEEWTVVTRFSEVSRGERVNILLSQGSLDCEVLE